VVALGVLLSACTQAAKVSQSVDPTGTYALVSVDGNQVPAKVTHEGVGLEVRSGTFTVNPDGMCATTTVFVPGSGNEVTRHVSATHARIGSKVTMRWQGAGMTTAKVEGDTLTMNNEGMLLVYKK
jgi:hypothetical protein